MTISERIFDRIGKLGMTQKVFSEKTGISQSTISEWKSKGTNPTSEKIMIICEVLGVTPEWLLSGSTAIGKRSNSIPEHWCLTPLRLQEELEKARNEAKEWEQLAQEFAGEHDFAAHTSDSK